jgi:hypothetical protein
VFPRLRLFFVSALLPNSTEHTMLQTTSSIAYSSPLGTLQPKSRHRHNSDGTRDEFDACPTRYDHVAITPITLCSPFPAPSSYSYADCTRSILEMDRERRTRREEARKEQQATSFMLFPSSSGTLQMDEGEEDRVSIGSSAGVCSSNRPRNDRSHPKEPDLGRGPIIHKRRRLCHHQHHYMTTSSDKQNESIPCSMMMVLPPKTAHSPPILFADTAHCFEDDFNKLPVEHPENEMIFMPSLREDEDYRNRITTSVTDALTMRLLYAEGTVQKRKVQHQQSNSPFLSTTTFGSRRTSPLHFYHAQKQQFQQQYLESPSECSFTISDRSIRMECRLQSRRNVTLEEEFTLRSRTTARL